MLVRSHTHRCSHHSLRTAYIDPVLLQLQVDGDGATWVDVILIMTTAVHDAIEASGGDPWTRVLSFVESTNAALRRSDVAIRLNVLRTFEVAYPSHLETNTSISLGWLRENTYFNQDLRDHMRADLILMVTADTGGACGVAYAPTAGFPMKDNPNWWIYSVAVTRLDCISSFTFEHEAGHLMGCL